MPRTSAGSQRWLRLVLLAALVLLVWYLPGRFFSGDLAPGLDPNSSGALADGNPALSAFEARRSDVEMTVRGVVTRVLADDNSGSRHQRFVISTGNDHTLLISHNIDLAPRVPLAVGEQVTAKGEFEWNERGGVLHWTHHDPRGQRAGGWIEHAGERYR